MKHRILVADSDEAFASLLKERLEALGEYQVAIVNNGNTLLERIITHPCDLLIMDVTLEGLSPQELLSRVHAFQPSLRIMAIPYPGNRVPFALKDIPVHGLLPKPFMSDELPLLIHRAFGTETALPLGQMATLFDAQTDVAEEADVFAFLLPEENMLNHPIESQLQDAGPDIDVEQPELAPEKLTTLSQEAPPVLRALERELRAELIVLSSKTGLLAYTGPFSRERMEDFCHLVVHRVESSTQIMRFLGTDEESIAMMLEEGERYRVYTTRVVPAVWLTVVIDLHIPIGSLRYHIRKAVEQLVSFLR